MRTRIRLGVLALLLTGCAGVSPHRDCTWVEPLSYCLAGPEALAMLHGEWRMVTVSSSRGRRDFLAVLARDDAGLEISATGLSGQPLFLVRYRGDTVSVSPAGALPSPERLIALLQFAYLGDEQLLVGLRDAPPAVHLESGRRGRRLLVDGEPMLEVERLESGERIRLPRADVEMWIRPVPGQSGLPAPPGRIPAEERA